MTKMARLTIEDRLLIKALRIEKGWSVDGMIAEFIIYHFIPAELKTEPM